MPPRGGQSVHVRGESALFVVDVVPVHKGEGVAPGRPYDVLEQRVALPLALSEVQLESPPRKNQISTGHT